MAKQTASQKQTVARVMHEFKRGELESGKSGRKVRNSRQAIAIALSEAGASDQQSPAENRRDRARTKAKERHGETAQQRAETGRRRTERGSGPRQEPTRAELYQQAKRRQIPGRSRMTRDELKRALER